MILLCLVLLSFQICGVKAWSNGGWSEDLSNPDYGTHDWIAQHALDWLSTSEKQYIVNNLAVYLYGTELPDNSQAPDGIADSINHHFYYDSAGAIVDDSAAVRASAVYAQALSFLISGDSANAAKYAGIMSHYIVDLAVFGHVMGSGTDWGPETHHDDYESYVNQRTSTYSAEFNVYLSFDGNLRIISAYNVARELAYDTTFDIDGDLTCIWMDQNYDWNNPIFKNRCGESLNLAVNYLADVLHTLRSESNSTNSDHVVINEVELNPPGDDAGNEWVELYNPSASAVEIGDWKITATAGKPVTITIASGTVIPANGYYIVTYASQWLDNKDEYLFLQNSTGAVLDNTILMSDEVNGGDVKTWQRYPDGGETWVFTEPSTKNDVNVPEFSFDIIAVLTFVVMAIGLMVLRRSVKLRRRGTLKKNANQQIKVVFSCKLCPVSWVSL